MNVWVRMWLCLCMFNDVWACDIDSLIFNTISTGTVCDSCYHRREKIWYRYRDKCKFIANAAFEFNIFYRLDCDRKSVDILRSEESFHWQITHTHSQRKDRLHRIGYSNSPVYTYIGCLFCFLAAEADTFIHTLWYLDISSSLWLRDVLTRIH